MGGERLILQQTVLPTDHSAQLVWRTRQLL